MTTVAADQYGDQDKPDPNEMIRRTVRALRSAHGVDATDLARHLKISRQSFYNRLNGASPWLAAEVAELADYFGCDVGDLYEGAVNLTRPLTTRTTPPPNGTGVTRPVTERNTSRCIGQGLAQVIDFPQVVRRVGGSRDDGHVTFSALPGNVKSSVAA